MQPPPPPATPLQPANYLEYAVYCYLQGVRLGNPAARAMLPRVLHLLSFDNDAGVVGAQLDRHAGSLPLWVWFMWTPQLLASLQRLEAAHVKPLLASLAVSFPQSIYYSLRTYLLSMREGAHKASQELARAKQARAAEEGGAEYVPDPGRLAEISAFEMGKEVMDVLRQKHPQLGVTLEQMLQDIGSKFAPKSEERLLSVVTALLHRCYKVPFAGQAEVPQLLKQELAGVCRACLQGDGRAETPGAAPSSARSGAGGSGSGLGHGALREAFVRDMSPTEPAFPSSLGELAESLKSWRNRLQAELDDKMPGQLWLEDECRGLSELVQRGGGSSAGSVEPVEMPGQYLAGNEVSADSVVVLEAFGANVTIVRRHSSSYRRLVLHGSDGHARHMLVQTGQNWAQGTTDERVVQLMRLLNRLMEAHPQARSRLMAFHTPLVVPVWPQVRMLEEDPSFCSYGDAYDVNCARYGREADTPISYFKRRCADEAGNIPKDVPIERRLQTYQEICQQLVSENVFSQYIYKTLPTCNHLWVFKKSLCLQMALSGLLCHMLLVGGRSPNKILYAKDTGRVFQTDFMPVYNERGQLEKIEQVPFRLTRNLATFFNGFGVEGLFATAIMNAAAAFIAKNSNAQHVLSMFFRDDIVAWAARRSGKIGFVAGMRNDTLKALVLVNVRKTLERARTVSPAVPSEDVLPSVAVAGGVLELIDAACHPKNLCRMEPTWHPWF